MTTIKGIYDNGQIVLDEIPPVKNKLKVVVTFLEETEAPPVQKRLGSLKGKISVRYTNTDLFFGRQSKLKESLRIIIENPANTMLVSQSL